MEQKPGGRPRQGADVKKAPLNMRTDPALRARIEAAADARNLSLTQEVERRLKASFALEEAGPDIEYMMHVLAHSAGRIQRQTGERITRNRTGWEALKLVTSHCLNLLRPVEDLNADRLRRELAELALRQRELQERAGEADQRYRALLEDGEDASQAAAEYSALQNELTPVMIRYGELRPLYEEAREELARIESHAAELAKEALMATRASSIAMLRASEEAAMVQEQGDGA